MYSFDSLTLKYFFIENHDFINGAIVQKIQLPSRYEIILNIRNLNNLKAQNKKLYININPKYPHICFINDKTQALRNIEIPQKPPMFCMQLRKYLNGSKIKDFKYIEYDRILEFYFDYFDEIGSLTRMCLCVEFMGKYSNVILYNVQNKIIIGAMHNVSQDKSSVREIYGGIKYFYPSLKQKLNLLNVSYATFYEIAKNKDIKQICDNFYYLNQSLLKKIFIDNQSFDIQNIFKLLQDIISYQNKEILYNFWSGGKTINEAIDNYFSKILFDEIMLSKKNKLKKYLSQDIKKLKNTISDMPDDTKAQNYKLKADLLMSYMYQIKQGEKEFKINDILIELDENISINDNIQKYYKLYKKAHSSFEYAKNRSTDAKNKLEYYETIIFNIENSSNFDELNEIENELIDLNLIKKENKKQIKISINKIEYKGYEIYIGKNNKQNDYLISKIADKNDLWFHGLNYPSAHIILKVPNNKVKPNKDILEFCAKLTKENSKAKDGGKTSIIMTERKNLKKPPDTYLGYVTYKNEIEIVV